MSVRNPVRVVVRLPVDLERPPDGAVTEAFLAGVHDGAENPDGPDAGTETDYADYVMNRAYVEGLDLGQHVGRLCGPAKQPAHPAEADRPKEETDGAPSATHSVVLLRVIVPAADASSVTDRLAKFCTRPAFCGRGLDLRHRPATPYEAAAYRDAESPEDP